VLQPRPSRRPGPAAARRALQRLASSPAAAQSTRPPPPARLRPLLRRPDTRFRAPAPARAPSSRGDGRPLPLPRWRPCSLPCGGGLTGLHELELDKPPPLHASVLVLRTPPPAHAPPPFRLAAAGLEPSLRVAASRARRPATRRRATSSTASFLCPPHFAWQLPWACLPAALPRRASLPRPGCTSSRTSSRRSGAAAMGRREAARSGTPLGRRAARQLNRPSVCPRHGADHHRCCCRLRFRPTPWSSATRDAPDEFPFAPSLFSPYPQSPTPQNAGRPVSAAGSHGQELF